MTMTTSCDGDTSPNGVSCGYNTDCPIPERCIDGLCRLECRVSTDCQQREKCFEGVCYARPSVCRDNEECAPFQEVCESRSGRCLPPGELTAGTNAGTTAGMTADTMAGAEGGIETGGESVVVSAGAENAGAETQMMRMGAYGDDCNCPSDCASGYCVVNKMKRRRTCSSGCEGDADCPGIDTCLQAQVRAQNQFISIVF